MRWQIAILFKIEKTRLIHQISRPLTSKSETGPQFLAIEKLQVDAGELKGYDGQHGNGREADTGKIST